MVRSSNNLIDQQRLSQMMSFCHKKSLIRRARSICRHSEADCVRQRQAMARQASETKAQQALQVPRILCTSIGLLGLRQRTQSCSFELIVFFL